ncbi:WbqC family protein [Polaromonas sp. JS666]|uniref:WbqC family protein n=1 Tax=Polaromonas sp. (strain JS666 / ATCC BAA-500) TaxID=296591 RepID=UPI0009F70E95|nr:WbqC family protein [Polaromonas sp. JS666]
MRSLAIMQPYFFPYLGYWQLISAVDKFVIYDDVNYIKSGWINRNRILVNAEPTYITVPLERASPYKTIAETNVDGSGRWRGKLAKMVALSYGRAPFFSEVFPSIENLIRHETPSLSAYLAHQISTLAGLLDIDTEFALSSASYDNRHLSGQDRVLDICETEEAGTYVNAIGGKAIYDPAAFARRGIDLRFISTSSFDYSQAAPKFVPHLSIIDLLMQVGFTGAKQHLQSYELIE